MSVTLICMKEIRVALEDKEYKQLLKTKGKLTWKQFLISGGKNERDKKNKTNIGKDH